MANKCKDCGCTCKRCISSDHDVQLHVEIENLKSYLLEKENHIVKMETNFLNEADKFPNGELVAIQEEVVTWQDKYRRLYDAHRRVQRVNQGLEDKLLKLVDVCETEKNALTKDVAILSHKLAEANYAIKKLTEDNERYKNDVSLAIQFLQCKQTSFVAKRYDSLPAEVQSQVSNFMSTKRRPEERKPPAEMRNIKVPIPTFPPTAMVYSVPKSPVLEREAAAGSGEVVSAAVMAKVLEERQREKANARHCETCTCLAISRVVLDGERSCVGTQTEEVGCSRCDDGGDANSIALARKQEPKSQKVVPICPLETSDAPPQTNHNVVKVQPNNFLLDEKSKSSSMSSSIVSKQTSSKNDKNNVLINIDPHLEATNENQGHDRFCVIDLTSERAESETSAKYSSPKGPRYCSMRQRLGSSNILLDNAGHNVPVLYTRTPRLQVGADTPAQSRQRVADWVRDSVAGPVDPADPVGPVSRRKYAEMEENVKRFLFGEGGLLKAGEGGLLRAGEVGVARRCTETEII